jgi:hypothetical protein
MRFRQWTTSTPREHLVRGYTLNQQRTEHNARSGATDLFGRKREDGRAALLGNLDQSVFGDPAYPTVESKAALARLNRAVLPVSFSRYLHTSTETMKQSRHVFRHRPQGPQGTPPRRHRALARTGSGRRSTRTTVAPGRRR